MNLQERIDHDRITISAGSCGYNRARGFEWDVILLRVGDTGSVSLKTTFFTGDITAPTAELVMKALLNDASTFVNTDGFEEWAAELGYTNQDEREYYRELYARVEEQTEQLQRFLGEDYDDYLWETPE